MVWFVKWMSEIYYLCHEDLLKWVTCRTQTQAAQSRGWDRGTHPDRSTQETFHLFGQTDPDKTSSRIGIQCSELVKWNNIHRCVFVPVKSRHSLISRYFITSFWLSDSDCFSWNHSFFSMLIILYKQQTNSSSEVGRRVLCWALLSDLWQFSKEISDVSLPIHAKLIIDSAVLYHAS